MSPEALARLSSILDQALEVPEAAREAWLAALAGPDAELAPRLRALLARRAERETADFLDRGPAFAPPQDIEAPGLAAGDAVGPYRLQRRLGAGGMGEVWLAERSDAQPRRAVALKLPMLGLRRGVLVQRFARERDILAALEHPHIARLYDAGVSADGQPYLALQYVDGRPVTEHVRERPADPRATVRLMLQVMGAVQHAHANLVIHRDLKPSNVLVTAEGQAMLLDFGIAKLLQEEQVEAGETELTRVGGRALTPAYAAPEQLTGAPVGIAVDIWALGVLLYELLAGERPFAGERQALEQAVLEAEPRPLRGLPPDLSTVVLKALKKLPAERYATVAAFGDDLQRWLDGRPVRAQPDSRWYRTRKFVVRNRLAVAGAAAVSCAVLAAAGISLWQAGVAREQARIAQTEARTAQAVQDFLQRIFKTSAGDQDDPVKARQRTAQELLDEGAARIDKELDEAPQAKMRVLATLASIYDDLGETERTAEMQVRRAALVDRSMPGAFAQRAQAHADLAMTLAVIGRDDEAAAHLKQAATIARQVPESDLETLIAVDMAQTQYFAVRGDARGLEPARRLVARMRQKPLGLGLVDALRMQGELEISAGLAADAVQRLDEADRLAQQLPGGGDYALVFVRLSRAAARAAAGQGPAAVDDARDALRRAAANTGEASSITILTMGVLGRILTEQGLPAQAMVPILEARRRLAADPSMAEVGDIVSRLRLDEARTLRRLGRLEASLAGFDEALAAAVAGKAQTRVFWCALGRAQVLTDLGRLDDAQAAVAQVRTVRDRLDLQGHSYVLALAQAEAGLALARGDALRATALWQALAADERTHARPQGAGVLALEAELALATEGPLRAADLARRALATLASPAPGAALPNAAYERVRLQVLLLHALRPLGGADEALAVAGALLQQTAEFGDPAYSPERLLALREAARIHDERGDAAQARAARVEAAAIAARHRQLGPRFRGPA